MMLALAAVLLQAAAPARQPDIVVLGARERANRSRQVSRDLDQMLPPTPPTQPLARFQGTLCPGIVGLSTASAQAVADRVAVVADRLGLSIGEPGCDPNLLVVVTADAEATTRDLVARRPGLFQGQDLAAIRRLRAERGGARAWVGVDLRNRDGEAPIVDYQGPRILSVPSVGRAALGFRYDIVSAVVMIDAAAARGRATDQIADYAVMRGLADARPDRLRHDRTVLAAFGSGDAEAPATLTPTDWGLLTALYAGRGDRAAGVVRGAMVEAVLASPDARP